MCTPLIFLDDLHTHDSTVETTGKLETQEEESKGETAAAFKSLFEAFRTCMSRVQRYNFQRMYYIVYMYAFMKKMRRYVRTKNSILCHMIFLDVRIFFF